ncbi:M3 family oligoendopeptidase [Deinococcus hopiensis]|uniref:Oligoendopeptidase F n=1 Tax=Deinococcus hopiensis KR-140 TaxID=695939 RepID=A0A1W1VV69_9DEIO|nr:M3 family oligoendopeptidase [Deinococcus hopiensis]SMB97120.1 oligoendopeptidase F [Deinococcus hopiensis KR-140]
MTHVTPTWMSFAPRYDALATEPLEEQDIPAWLQRWSDLEKDVMEVQAQLTWAKDANPSDTDAEHAFLRFIQEVQPESMRAEQRLRDRLLAFTHWQPTGPHVQMLRRLRCEAALFREENLPLINELTILANEFNKITGAQRATVNGEEMTLPEAQRLLLDPNRTVREAAWRGIATANLQAAPQLDALFLKLLHLRRKVAHNAGLENYRDFTWQAMNRFDYTPQGIQELHQAVEAHVVPLQLQLHDERRRNLGVDVLRPWDTAVDPQGRPPLRPFQSTDEYITGAERIFHALDPELGAQFSAMREGGFLDLEPRSGKVPGYGYCNYLPRTGSPYIYWSAVGTDGDVRVLMHEAGHAFHFLASGTPDDLVWNQLASMEFAEVGSQAMELLTLPLLERPTGYYDAEDAARAKKGKIETVLRQFTGQALGDAFQQWLYADAPENVTTAEIDAKWLECSERFSPGVNWEGLEDVRAKGWQFVHIFAYPLYLIEYSLAWIGALQIWQNARQDPGLALKQYKQALSLGNTRPLPELFETAGARFALDAPTVGQLMTFLQEQLTAST